MIVVAEIFVARWFWDFVSVAVVLTVPNAVVLEIRIRAEDAALRPARQW